MTLPEGIYQVQLTQDDLAFLLAQSEREGKLVQDIIKEAIEAMMKGKEDGRIKTDF